MSDTLRVSNLYSSQVGIGTAAPSAQLQIVNASMNRLTSIYVGPSTQSGIVLDSTSGASGRSFNIWSTASADSTGVGSLAFFDITASAYRMVINSSGYVGIGVATPSGPLHVNANTSTSGAFGQALIIANPLGNAATRPAISVGAANTSIWATNTLATTADDGFIRIAAGGGTSATTKSYIDISGYSTVADMDRSIVLGTAGSERMRINLSGLVGIGASNPMYKTQIVLGSNSDPGTSNVFGLTTADSSTQSQRLYMGLVDNGGTGSNSYSWISASRFGYAYNTLALQPSSGNVGIGTTVPGYALHVVGAIFATGNVTAYSDQRYKQNITRLDGSLDAIRSLSGYSYTRLDYLPGVRQIGLLAQEVKTVLPEAVSYDSTNDIYSVNYNCLMAPVVEAIKELYDRSEAQAKIIEAQQSTIQKLMDRLESL